MTEKLDDRQIDATLREAAEGQLPLVVSVVDGERWVNLSSRLLEVSDGAAVIQWPAADEGEVSHEFAPGESIHLTFRLGPDKYALNATVLDPRETPPQTSGPGAMGISRPTKIQRLQRRASTRISLTSGEPTEACFWLGERIDEPEDLLPERPAWPGTVVDLSEHGVRLLADRNSCRVLEFGDSVGLKFSLGEETPPLCLDGQYRHLQSLDDDDQKVLMGFLFTGLDERPECRATLESLIAKIQTLSTAASAT